MPTASLLLIIVTPLINPFYQTAADAIPRNKQTMIHDFCQIGPLTLNPDWSQAAVCQREGGLMQELIPVNPTAGGFPGSTAK